MFKTKMRDTIFVWVKKILDSFYDRRRNRWQPQIWNL